MLRIPLKNKGRRKDMFDFLGKINFREPLTRFQDLKEDRQMVYEFFKEYAEKDWQEYLNSHPDKKKILNSPYGDGGSHRQQYVVGRMWPYPLFWGLDNRNHGWHIDFWGQEQRGLHIYKEKTKWWVLFDKIFDVIYFWDRLWI